MNRGRDWERMCCKKHPECPRTLVMWKPLLGADLHFKGLRKDTEQNNMGKKVMRM